MSDILTCTACRLHTTRTQVVPGHGSRDARIALIAEAPGRDEDEQGYPLVGKAGQHLDELLERVGLNRDELFLDNIVHCRPPGNRIVDYPDAVVECRSRWLLPTLDALERLRVIVTLGATAGAYWFPGKSATEMSKLARVEGNSNRIIVGAFHPAYALRLHGQGEGNWVDESIIASLRRAQVYGQG